MKPTKVKASKLVMDYELYPRERIDDFHVKQMVEALRAEVEFPPLLACKKTLRIVDGFHRTRAHQRYFGVDVELDVYLKTYNSELEIFQEAMRLNVGHGRSLTIYDKARCITKAESLGMEPDQIATALAMTPQRLSEMRRTRFASHDMQPVALKRTTAHFAGSILTEEQIEYNTKAGGLQQSFYVNQVVAMLEAESVDTGNEKLLMSLRRLHELLDAFMLAIA